MLLLKQCTSSHNTFSIGIISIFLPTIFSSVEPNAFSSQPDGIKFKTNPMPFQQVIPSQNTSYTSSLTNHSLELNMKYLNPKLISHIFHQLLNIMCRDLYLTAHHCMMPCGRNLYHWNLILTLLPPPKYINVI